MELSTAQVCGGGHAGAAKVLTGTGTLSSYEARDSSGSGHWARHEEVWLPPLDMGGSRPETGSLARCGPRREAVPASPQRTVPQPRSCPAPRLGLGS